MVVRKKLLTKGVVIMLTPEEAEKFYKEQEQFFRVSADVVAPVISEDLADALWEVTRG